jgi:hypothetical protein
MWSFVVIAAAIGYAVVVHALAYVGGVYFLGLTYAQWRLAKAYPAGVPVLAEAKRAPSSDEKRPPALVRSEP